MGKEDMRIYNREIYLRDMNFDDIEDYIKWNTTEIEWQNWDAPWESEENFDIEAYKDNLIRKLNTELPPIRRRFEICLIDNTHIGWMNSYHIVGNKDKLAIGIDIPSNEFRGKNLGEFSFSLFISYLLSSSEITEIYTETWSGNIRMTNLAKKCCFELVERMVDFREVNGAFYDKLVFKLNNDKFKEKYSFI